MKQNVAADMIDPKHCHLFHEGLGSAGANGKHHSLRSALSFVVHEPSRALDPKVGLRSASYTLEQRRRQCRENRRQAPSQRC